MLRNYHIQNKANVDGISRQENNENRVLVKLLDQSLSLGETQQENNIQTFRQK